MITSSSISYISQVLDNPQNISDADAESIRLLTQTYPYFVPARYMSAAQEHKEEPFTPATVSSMQLYMGNWLLYSQFLQSALGGEMVEMDATPVQKPVEPKEKPVEIEEPVQQPVPQPVEEDEPVEEEKVASPPPAPVVVEEEPEEILLEAEEVYDEPVQEEKEPEEFVPANTGFITGKKQHVSNINKLIEEIPAQQNPAFKKPLWNNDNSDEGLIPPIYTEDYFLHQGLHVSNQIPAEMNVSGNVPDRIDPEKSLMVVMSFSEWLMYYKKKKQQEQEEVKDQKTLKTMWQKEKLAAALEEENEEIPENVFEMAVNSISKEENLISESLAEVYVKQGRYDRAIEMYKKLSLRKPQKKAYFARRIEDILKEK